MKTFEGSLVASNIKVAIAVTYTHLRAHETDQYLV